MSDRVQRLPTAYLLPIVARTENSALPFKGQLSDKIHHRRLRRTRKRLRCAAIVFNYGCMLQRNLPAGFIAPCLPTKTDKLPSGDLWLHESSMTASESSHARMATACGSTAVQEMT